MNGNSGSVVDGFYVNIMFGDRLVSCLVDTGANITIIKSDITGGFQNQSDHAFWE